MTIVDINSSTHYNQINRGGCIMHDVSKFKDRLKELRKNYNMTQEELANRLGIVRTAITNYETGRTSPDPETLSIIANILNTTTDYLLGRTDINISVEELLHNISKPSHEDAFTKEIHNLSPESQEELKKLIELYKMRDMQKRNIEVSDELSTLD